MSNLKTNLANAEMSRLLNQANRITKKPDKVFELMAQEPEQVKDEKLKKIVKKLNDLKFKFDVIYIKVSYKDDLFKVNIITN